MPPPPPPCPLLPACLPSTEFQPSSGSYNAANLRFEVQGIAAVQWLPKVRRVDHATQHTSSQREENATKPGCATTRRGRPVVLKLYLHGRDAGSCTAVLRFRQPRMPRLCLCARGRAGFQGAEYHPM